MRAAVFQGVGKGLAVEEIDDPTPDPRFVVVRVGRCGICGSDLQMTKGEGFLTMPAGARLGHEIAGEVVAVGAEVESLREGDHVCVQAVMTCGRCPACLEGRNQWCTGADKLVGLGGYAEYASVAEPQCVKLPASLPWQDGALVEPVAVGMHGVHLAGLAPGARMLVIGAGPVALSAVFFARRMGASQVAVLATSRRREEWASTLGATSFVTSDDDPVAAVTEALSGAPDVVVEAAGVPGTIELGLRAVRPQGTVIVLGWCTVPDSYTPAIYMNKEIRLQFSMTYVVSDFRHVIDVLSGDGEPLRALVSETVALGALPEMFETLRGPAHQCKVLVDPWA